MQTADETILLSKGHYLAPSFEVCELNNLLVGVTNHGTPVTTGHWHAHEHPMISFVLYGNNVEYRKGQVIERNTGCINYYHAYEPHKNIYHQFPSKHISLELNPAFLAQYHYSENQIEQAVQQNRDALFTFIKLLKEAFTNDVYAADAVEMLFLAFIEEGLQVKNEAHFPSWIKHLREILHDRWNETLSLQELSDQVNVYPTTISKYFKRYFQCTLGEYARKLKIHHSIELLHTAHYSLTETAHICGFSDQSHFTRVFKSMMGYLPKEYVKLKH